MRKSRLAQVHMHVHESRDDGQPLQIDDAVAVAGRCIRGDAALLDGQRLLDEAAAAEDTGVDIDGLHGFRQKNRATEKQLP